ncbi:MAG: NAD(P)-dependent oxidoreductase [Rhizomicrobium sp.]|jgi:precorrin-2 dehydrogenase/sirohydrochlorin ferrochelatase
MLPIVLTPQAGRIALAGEGAAFDNRLQWLLAAGVAPEIVGPASSLTGFRFLFAAGLSKTQADALARRARTAGVLVNVEDMPALCDFHVPALVRRGDLVIAVSTGGRAPGLAKLLRQWLDARFGPEWAGYLDQASDARATWRGQGAPAEELSRRTREMAAEGNWLS